MIVRAQAGTYRPDAEKWIPAFAETTNMAQI